MLLLLITQMCMCFEYVFWNSNVLDKLYAPYPWSGNSYRIHLTPNVKKKRGVSILRIETRFFYFRYYLICKYNGMWGLERNSYILSNRFLNWLKTKIYEGKHYIKNETYPFRIQIYFCFVVLLVKKRGPSLVKRKRSRSVIL